MLSEWKRLALEACWSLEPRFLLPQAPFWELPAK